MLTSAERFALSPSWQQRDQSSSSQLFERCTGTAALNPISLRHARTRFTTEGLVLRYLALAITFYQMQTEFRLLWSKIGNMLEPNILPTHDRQHILEGLKIRKYTLFYIHKVSRNPIETHRRINSYCNTLLYSRVFFSLPKTYQNSIRICTRDRNQLKCSNFIDFQSCALRFSGYFCLCLIRLFPGSFCETWVRLGMILALNLTAVITVIP